MFAVQTDWTVLVSRARRGFGSRYACNAFDVGFRSVAKFGASVAVTAFAMIVSLTLGAWQTITEFDEWVKHAPVKLTVAEKFTFVHVSCVRIAKDIKTTGVCRAVLNVDSKRVSKVTLKAEDLVA